MAKKEITKSQANKAANVVKQYAIQEAKKSAKKGAIATKNAAGKIAKKGFNKLKTLFQ